MNLADDEAVLLLAQLGALRGDLIRDFLRDQGVSPLSGRKDQLVSRIEDAISEGQVSWQELIEYLDRVEPYNKQHVTLYRVAGEIGQDWTDPEILSSLLKEHGLGELWQKRIPLAAPEGLVMSSVSLEDKKLEVYAIGRRAYPQRRKDREQDISLGPRFEARVYENVEVRSWVRLSWDLEKGRASLHISQLPRKGLYEEIRNDFINALESWIPFGAFEPLNLAKAVSRIEKAEIEKKAEARIQAVGHNSYGGLRSNVSSGAPGQSVYGESPDYDEALRAIHESGPGAGGSFYFLPQSGSGLPGNPLTEEVHVVLVVKDDRINFPRYTQRGDLEYVLSRLRVLAG